MSETPKKSSKRKSKRSSQRSEDTAQPLDETTSLEASVDEDADTALDQTAALDVTAEADDEDTLDQTATLDVTAPAKDADAVDELDKTASLRRRPGGKTADKAPPKKRWRLLGWLIVIVFLAAASASIYWWWQQQDIGKFAIASDADVSALRDDLRAVEAASAALKSEVAAIREENARFQQQINGFANDVNKRLQGAESIGGRVSGLESAVASVQGISQGSRNTWLLAEAEYYLQIANAQLNLAGNSDHALLALKLADERVRELADPAYTEVRRALADEIQKLETFSKVDIEGISLTLASLSRVVDSLPIQEQFSDAEEDTPAAIADEDLGGLERAGAAVRNALKDVVSVRRVDQQARPLLAPEARYFLRANMALQLQAARLALLRGEKASFEQSLEDASTWLQDHFVADSAPVVSALATIEDIRNTTLEVEYPDISGSLRLLRQQRTLASDAQ